MCLFLTTPGPGPLSLCLPAAVVLLIYVVVVDVAWCLEHVRSRCSWWAMFSRVASSPDVVIISVEGSIRLCIYNLIACLLSGVRKYRRSLARSLCLRPSFRYIARLPLFYSPDFERVLTVYTVWLYRQPRISHHRQRGSVCTVLTATGLVSGEWEILTPYRIETLEPID